MAERWQEVFRIGIAPQLSDAGLEALAVALRDDSPQLLQGCTTEPPPLPCVMDFRPEAACLIGYAGWQGDGLNTVSEVDKFFNRACFICDEVIGEPGAVGYVVNLFDGTPRDEMRRLFLPEVEAVLAARKAVTA